MNNAKMYEYFSYGSSSSDKAAKEADVKRDPMDEKLEKIKRERGIDTKEPFSDSDDADELDDVMVDKIDEQVQDDSDGNEELDQFEGDAEKSKKTGSKKSKKFTIKVSSQKPTSKMSKRSHRSTNSKFSRRSKTSKKQGSAADRINENFNLLDVPIAHHNDTMR